VAQKIVVGEYGQTATQAPALCVILLQVTQLGKQRHRLVGKKGIEGQRGERRRDKGRGVKGEEESFNAETERGRDAERR
jgi:hypothetical protein